MKLNPDCIRDILICIEENTTYNDEFVFHESEDKYLTEYSIDVVQYHLRQCYHIGFFTDYVENLVGDITIEDLSPLAHQFLADIRNENIWNKTKDTAAKVGSFSLNALMQIASNVVTNMINSAL